MVAISGVKLGLFTDKYGSILKTAQQFGALYVAQAPQAAIKLMSSRQNQNPRKRPHRN